MRLEMLPFSWFELMFLRAKSSKQRGRPGPWTHSMYNLERKKMLSGMLPVSSLDARFLRDAVGACVCGLHGLTARSFQRGIGFFWGCYLSVDSRTRPCDVM
jgi:hypothetical protein